MKVAVLGAGPAGLTAALTLVEKGAEVLVLDRLPFVGGASASRPIGDGTSRMDFGPHVFHVKNPEVNEIFYDFSGGDARTKKRNERILVRGGLFKYPLEITEVISRLTPGHLLWMGSAFAVARIRRKLFPMAEDNFESWGVSHFGRPLYEFSCGKYTEKVWGMRPSLLSAKLAQQKLKDLRLRDIVAKFMGIHSQELNRYWEDYAYPEKGIGIVFENMARRIEERGGSFALGAALRTIDVAERTARAVGYVDAAGAAREYLCDAVVNTIPLTHLATALSEGGGDVAIDSARQLKYRGLALINAVFDVDQVMPYDWVYLLDEIFQCNRVTEQKNMGGEMIEKGKTVLCFELAATPGDAYWTAPDEALVNVAQSDMEKIGFMDHRRCSAYHVTRLEEAYPVYTLDFNLRIEETMKTLASTSNIFSAGRQGLFLNNDIHDSMEMGMRVGRHISSRADTKTWYDFAWNYIVGRIEKK